LIFGDIEKYILNQKLIRSFLTNLAPKMLYHKKSSKKQDFRKFVFP